MIYCIRFQLSVMQLLVWPTPCWFGEVVPSGPGQIASVGRCHPLRITTLHLGWVRDEQPGLSVLLINSNIFCILLVLEFELTTFTPLLATLHPTDTYNLYLRAWRHLLNCYYVCVNGRCTSLEMIFSLLQESRTSLSLLLLLQGTPHRSLPSLRQH